MSSSTIRFPINLDFLVYNYARVKYKLARETRYQIHGNTDQV